jgi:hypothetical protein
VKLPTVPDPLQSFLAAVGAPAMQPTAEAEAPEEAPGAAMPATASMPNIFAQAPGAPAAKPLLANPVPDFLAAILATPDAQPAAKASPIWPQHARRATFMSSAWQHARQRAVE